MGRLARTVTRPTSTGSWRCRREFHGDPVRGVSINIEKDYPKLTAQFIKQTGAEFVLNDLDGALLAKFNGAARRS